MTATQTTATAQEPTPEAAEERWDRYEGRRARYARPRTVSDLTTQLVDHGGARPAQVAAAVDRIVSAGLDIAEQPDGDVLLSAGEVRILFEELEADVDWPSKQYHWECCPLWCGSERWHEAHGEAERVGYIEHGTTLATVSVPEVRRTPNRVTRPDQGRWRVGIHQGVHVLDGKRTVDGVLCDTLVEDVVFTLSIQNPAEVGTTQERSIRLLPGEVRQLATELIRAADVLGGLS